MGNDERERVYALCWRVLRHRQDAEDAAQDALLKIARAGASIEPARYPAWVYRVALNAAVDLARRRKRPDVPGAPSAPVDAAAVHEAVAELPDAERAAVVEHYFHRRTLREIAEAEGVTEQAIWKRVERAKERLRGALALAAGAALPFLDADARRAWAAAAWSAKLALPLTLAPVALLLAVGGAAWIRPQAPPASSTPPAPPAPPALAAAELVLPAPSSPPAPPLAAPRVRPPYPLALPPASWTKSRADTWRRLYERLITLSASEAKAGDILREITRLSGEIIVWEDVDVSALITIQMDQAPVGTCLEYYCEIFGLVFDVQDDGIVRLLRRDGAPNERMEELSRLRERRQIVADVEGRLRATGTLQGADLERPRPRPDGDSPGERLFKLCSDAGVQLTSRDLNDEFSERIHRPGPGAPGERPLSEHLDLFCAEFGLGWWEEDGRVTIAAPDVAAAQREALRAERERWEAELDRPLGPPAASYAELAERLEAVLKRPVALSESLWTSDRVPPSASTVREALRDVEGVLWTRRGGLLIGVPR